VPLSRLTAEESEALTTISSRIAALVTKPLAEAVGELERIDSDLLPVMADLALRLDASGAS
jgi:hypothetical protein